MERSRSEKDILAKFANTLDQHIRGVQYGLYGLGVAGLFVALRSVRPFQKLSRPTSVPRSFIVKQVPLSGVVKGAELSQGSALLQVAHRPLVSLGRANSPPYLPVTLAGVSPTMNGLSWLNITLEKEPVIFTVLSTNQHAANALVTHQGKDVGARMVELGLAKVIPYDATLERNAAYKKIYTQLLKCERKAERYGNGMWWGHARLHIRLASKICSRLRLLAAQISSQMPRKLIPAR